MVKATWNGAVIAQSDDTIVVEGNHYFPPDAVDSAHIAASDEHTTCAWKGGAHYYDVVVGGQRLAGGAWYYPDPLPEADALGIKGYVAFWRGVTIE